MIEYIKLLLKKWCCKHDWVELKHIKIYYTYFGEYMSNLPDRHVYLYKCKKCGKFKKIKL